jgi:hypothetical protein
MKAYISGGHYHIHIDEKREFPSLRDSPLEVNLQDDSDGSDTGKKVMLKYEQDARNFSIDFVPPEAAWDELREIKVTINREQYERLRAQRLEVQRFGGGSSVDLHLEEDISGFI